MVAADNLTDFPPDALPTPLTRQSLDDFLLDALDLQPSQVVTAVRAIASIAAYMHTHSTPTFGERLLTVLGNPAHELADLD